MTTVYKRCPTCRGTKTIMGMGTISKRCESCNASGYIDETVLEVTPIKPVVVQPVVSTLKEQITKPLIDLTKANTRGKLSNVFNQSVSSHA